jgi:hypothetical protein
MTRQILRYRYDCFLYRLKLWRSATWHRGHEVGYKLGKSHIARDMAYYKRLERYYFAHANDCQRNGCSTYEKLRTAV